eukprot:gene7101-7904_t
MSELLALAAACLLICVQIANANQNSSNMLTQVFPGGIQGYDSRILPTEKGEPVKVQAKLMVSNLGETKAIHSHFGIELVIHTVWVDHRLKFNQSLADDFRLVGQQTELIWTPDITFEQKLGKGSHVTDLNTFAAINSNGTILQSRRCMLLLYCRMDFAKFPFDEQTCTIPAMSYAYDDAQLELDWYKGLTDTSKSESVTFVNSKMNAFYIEDYSINKTKKDYGFSGARDTLTLTLTLHRKLSQYLVRIYLPLCLIVLLSFVSFWVDYRSSPARTIIATTIFLTAMIFIASLQTSFPPTTSVRSVDFYSLGCFLFVFGTMIEFALVQSVDIKVRKKLKSQKKKKAKIKDGPNRVSPEGIINPSYSSQEQQDRSQQHQTRNLRNRKSVYQRVVDKIYEEHEQHYDEYHVLDKISKKVFPAAFIIMNIIYFSMFTLFQH